MNPYQTLVSEYARWFKEGKQFPLGGFPPTPSPALPSNAPKALIFSPHPDDECIIGGLALRLLREGGTRVLNVAVTQGSRKDRQAERFLELRNACTYLGYGLIQTAPSGLERISPKTRAQEPVLWQESVKSIAAILHETQPHTVFVPHEHDWNSTHIGTHFLVFDALHSLGDDFQCFVIETEYWGQMTSPNLMVESSPEQVADLVTGTSFHVGEVRRNPFHLLLPAWMQDNVRRGSELVGGQGEAAPDFSFATLYRLRQWRQGQVQSCWERGRYLPRTENPNSLFCSK